MVGVALKRHGKLCREVHSSPVAIFSRFNPLLLIFVVLYKPHSAPCKSTDAFATMAISLSSSTVCFPLLILFVAQQVSLIAGSDPDPLQDFCVAYSSEDIFVNGFLCRNPQSVIPQHFKTSVLREEGNTSASPFGSSVTLTTVKKLPGLNTQGVVLARTDIAAGGIVPPHFHPRASEIVFVIKGKLLVGFVDTSNKLFSQKLKEGDAFVFPRGLVHFLYNVGGSPVLTISGLNSQNPGASLVPLATFASQPPIPPQVLEKAFQISQHEVENIRKNLGA